MDKKSPPLKMKKQRVLIGCEESQAVCIAFREQDIEAYSCDTQDCSGGHPEWHIKEDILKVIKGGTFKTQAGTTIVIKKWVMGIFHPPCTFITKAGTRWLFPKGKLNEERYKKGLEAKDFFMKLLNVDIKMVAVENPVPHKVFDMPKETQIIQPYYFGHKAQKATCLWLKNLPKLQSTNSLMHHRPPEFMRDNKGIRHSKWFMDCGFNSKLKSKTFEGVARAMAKQWGALIKNVSL